MLLFPVFGHFIVITEIHVVVVCIFELLPLKKCTISLFFILLVLMQAL